MVNHKLHFKMGLCDDSDVPDTVYSLYPFIILICFDFGFDVCRSEVKLGKDLVNMAQLSTLNILRPFWCII